MSENLSKEPAMMLYGHLKENVKVKFKQHNFQLAIISTGLTSVCQLLDVLINKPFKDNLQKEWHEWMYKGGSGVTEGEDNIMVYEEIDRLIAEYEKENLEELGDNVEIVCN
ncbi:unnamed protein product [Rhizophagus irregularis]|nr:unnamed protein product [Rhizophagus irregularis]